jgi:hypothetical protein
VVSWIGASTGQRSYLEGLVEFISFAVVEKAESNNSSPSLFGWLVADAWCWFLLIEEYCWLVAGGWFVLREKYCWLVADKPSEQGGSMPPGT